MLKVDKTVQEVCPRAITANKSWEYGFRTVWHVSEWDSNLNVLIEASQLGRVP